MPDEPDTGRSDAMAMDPEFFVRRREGGDVAEADLTCAKAALLAAVEAATAPVSRRRDAAALGFRALRDACFALPPHLLVGLTFPVGVSAYLQSLEQPCETWLPLARELGVASARLLLIGLATPACRGIHDRFA